MSDFMDKMAAIESLFYDKDEFEKQNMTELPQDPSQWSAAILQHAYETIPILANFKDVKIAYNKIEANKGYGLGNLCITTETNGVYVPFIVKNFMLFPMDVFIDKDGKFRPAAENRIKKALFDPRIVETLEKNKDTGFSNKSLMNEMYPPNTMGALGGSLESVGSDSILNAIINTLQPEDIAKTAAALENDPVLLLRYSQSNSADSLNKILEATTNIKTAGAYEGPDMQIYDIFQVTDSKYDPNMKMLKMASSVFSDREELELHRDDLTKLAEEMAAQGQNAVQQAQQNQGEIMQGQTQQLSVPDGNPVQQGTPPQSMTQSNYLDIDACMNMAPIEVPGSYSVMTQMGDKLVGYGLPAVFDFNLSPVPVKLFAGMGQAAMQQEIIGELIDSTARPKLSIITENKSYIFVYFGDKEGQALALVPVQVASMVTVSGQVVYLVMDMMQGAPYALIPMKGLKTIMPATPDMLGELMVACGNVAAVYYIPADTVGIEFTQMTTLIQSPQEAVQIMQMGGPQMLAQQQQQQQAQQQAQQQPQADPNAQQQAAPKEAEGQSQTQPQEKTSSFKGRVTYDYPTGLYDLESREFDKVAKRNLTAEELRFELAANGVEKTAAVKIAEHAKLKGVCTVYNMVKKASTNTVMSMLKVASTVGFEEIAANRPDTIKLASFLDSDDDVDTVLALNFMRPENMDLFIRSMSNLESAESSLSALLMSIRLGLKAIPEGLVKECLVKLSKIIDELKKII